MSMTSDKIKEILRAMPDVETLEVTGDGQHFQILMVSAVFEGKNTLHRQKQVYQYLNDYIANGSLHAVEIKTYTPQEWVQK